MKVLVLAVLTSAAHANTGAEGLVAAYAAQAKAQGKAKTKATPVEKVIELMNGMLEKGKSEMEAEQIQFAKFKTFCEGTTVSKTKAIKEAGEMIETLKADIAKYIADADTLAAEIAQHEEDISVWTGDGKAATKVRDIEKADYDAMHKDYSGAIDAFVQTDQESLAVESLDARAPEANAYEFQSQGIIDMLQKLLDKFTNERKILEKEEVDSKHAYEMLMQDLENSIEQGTADRDRKAETKAKKLQAKADAEGDLTDTTTTMEDDTKYLTDPTATCEQKANAFAERQTLRQEELEAITKAIEIISSAAVSGASEKHLPQFLQNKGVALAQLRAHNQSPTQTRVAEFLQNRAKQLNSRVLSALAVRVSADPFKKVKKMIKDLITRLLEEANEEATHKGWCDTELGTNAQTRKEKTEKVETLHAEIDELTSSIAFLTEEITTLTEQVAAIDAAVAKATKIREAEKAKNTETIADAKGAQEAVAQALQVLNEFYAKAGEATALVQQQPEAPEIFDEPYKGMGGEAGGVVGMLEVIQSDFARLEAETTAAEELAAKEYEEFMNDSEIDKTAKTKDIEHKTQKKQDQEQALEEKKADLEGTQKELDAALDYFEKLKPDCVDTGESYEERVTRRKEEIESLQEALRILNGEDLA